MPLLFVCEDNGRGISVPTPQGWIEATFSSRPSLRYAQADGTDPLGVHDLTTELADHVRATGRPALLHLRTVRYLGHAGTDVEAGYRSPASIRGDYLLDPILATARALVESGHRTPADLVDEYLTIREHVRKQAVDMTAERTLLDADEVIAPLSPTAADRRRRHGLAPARSRSSRRSVRRHVARGGGPADARRVDQPHRSATC